MLKNGFQVKEPLVKQPLAKQLPNKTAL